VENFAEFTARFMHVKKWLRNMHGFMIVERVNCVIDLLTEIDTIRAFDYLCHFTFVSFRVHSTTQLKRGTGNSYTLQLISKSQQELCHGIDTIPLTYIGGAMFATPLQKELDFVTKLYIQMAEIRARNEHEGLDTPERRLEDLAWRIDIAKRVERARLAAREGVA
jgi:hypothetical protein